MNSYAKPARKSKAQRELEHATARLRRPEARLVLMHTSTGKHWFITPDTWVSGDIAAKLIDRPDVMGGKDGLWPGHDQTWRFV